MERHIFSVTELNQAVKRLLDGEPVLQNVYVRGELSNYKMYSSGHHYFTLKDSNGALRCVMFSGQASGLCFRPENGMKVIAQGRISAFPRDGVYQLYCNALIPEGAGDLAVAFEQLKAKLLAEGLFNPAHKKPLPPYPEKIAIITSSAGKAVHDIIRSLRRRYPLAKGSGAGGPAGNRGRHTLRQPVAGGGRHHHRPGRRKHGGAVGLQRRAGGPGHLRVRAAGHLRRGP